MKADGWEFASHTWGHKNVGETDENFGANYELTEKEYVIGETIVPGTEKKSAAQLKKTEEVTA